MEENNDNIYKIKRNKFSHYGSDSSNESQVSDDSSETITNKRSSHFSYYSGILGCGTSDGEISCKSRVESGTTLDVLMAKYSDYSEQLKDVFKKILIAQKNANKDVNKHRLEFEEYKQCGGKIVYEKYYPMSTLGVRSVGIAKDGKTIVIGFNSGYLIVVDHRYKLKKVIYEGSEAGYPITCIKFDPTNDDIFYVSSTTGEVKVCSLFNDVDSIDLINEHENEINSIDIFKSGNCLITAGKDSQLRLYDIETYTEVAQYETRLIPKLAMSGCHEKRLYMVRCNPDLEYMFASGGWDKCVKLWDIRNYYSCICNFKDIHIFGDSLDIKHNRLLTASWAPECKIQLWDLRQMRRALIYDCNPKNSLKPADGEYTVVAQFLDYDATGDLILKSSMTHKSLDVVSLKNNLLVHSFTSNSVVDCCHSRDEKIAFGTMYYTFVEAIFNSSLPAHEFHCMFSNE